MSPLPDTEGGAPDPEVDPSYLLLVRISSECTDHGLVPTDLVVDVDIWSCGCTPERYTEPGEGRVVDVRLLVKVFPRRSSPHKIS